MANETPRSESNNDPNKPDFLTKTDTPHRQNPGQHGSAEQAQEFIGEYRDVPAPDPSVASSATPRDQDLVDEASRESFPASDAPNWRAPKDQKPY